MPPRVMKLVVFAGMLALAPVVHAQAPGNPDSGAAQLTAELIGGSVYGSDGVAAGTVTDLALDENGQPRALRMQTASRLGIGARIVEVPRGWFTMLRGAVVLDMPAEAVEFLPEAVEDESD